MRNALFAGLEAENLGSAAGNVVGNTTVEEVRSLRKALLLRRAPVPGYYICSIVLAFLFSAVYLCEQICYTAAVLEVIDHPHVLSKFLPREFVVARLMLVLA